MIDALFTDVDGVLTNGGYYYGENGLLMKKFHTRDAAAGYRLQAAGIPLLIITSATDRVTKKRMTRMRAKTALYGVQDKLSAVEGLCKANGWRVENIAYIGDDHMDLPVLRAAGRAFCPNDSSLPVINLMVHRAGIVCKRRGGEGVLAEVVDTILGGS